MICPGCGAPVPDVSRFCNMCGATVASPVAVAVQPQQYVGAPAAAALAEQRIWELRPAFLFVGFRYVVAAIVWLAGTAAIAALASNFQWPLTIGASIVAALGVLLFLFPIVAHIKRQRVLYTLTTHKLEIREGLLSTTVRNIPLAKVQDVTVTRSLLERLLGVGSITIDNASETAGSVTIAAVREPQTYADLLLAELRKRN